MNSVETRYIPLYPISQRPRLCPAHEDHPISYKGSEICGLSRLMQDIRASEGSFPESNPWTKISFSAKELEDYNFKVSDKKGEVCSARCNRCGLVMDLWKQKD